MPIGGGLRFVFVSFVLLTGGCAATNLQVWHLRCDYQSNSLEVDENAPRLSWIDTSHRNGAAQSAFEILVASEASKLSPTMADLWDSGKIFSGTSIGIPYGGRSLRSQEQCWWTVRVWDEKGQCSRWSEPARWAMGLLHAQDWTAQWISSGDAPATRGVSPLPLPIFRKEFGVTARPHRAIVYICGLGQFELHINGRKVSEDFLQPGWTDYRKTCLYVAYDVTTLIKSGRNAIGVMLGNGMYNVVKRKGRYAKFSGSFGPPKLIAQLELEGGGCGDSAIITDSTWKFSRGPITFSSIYGGEDYDARREQAGWDQPGFDDSEWSAAKAVDGPGGVLRGGSRSAPPIGVARVFGPEKVTRLSNGDWVYDLGQNCAMVPEFVVRGAAGASVRLTPGELLAADGSVSQRSSGLGVWDTYILRGDGDERWSPRFVYHGCRYIGVHTTGDARVRNLVGRFVTSESPISGEFGCSSELFDRTAALIDWAIRSNMVSILTDCPHRERLGWLEQDHLMGPSLLYGHDIAPLLRKICGDMRDAQHADGLVPDIAPEYVKFKDGFLDSPEWGSACVLLPWNMYLWYGDTGALAESYPSMQKYVEYLASRAKDNVLSYGLGDWYDLGPQRPGISQLTPPGLTATAFYYHDLDVLAKSAAALGRASDAAQYALDAAEVAKAFNAAFYHPLEHFYGTNSQTANAIPIVFGIAPPADVPMIVDQIVRDMRSRGDALTAGDVGYRFVLQALADHGQSEEIFRVNDQSSKPGYGYQLKQGATSLTEAWNADPQSSQDHLMLGHILEWFYRDVAGIQPAPDSVAFDRIWIEPAMVGDLKWARGRYDSIRGSIESEWRRDGTNVTLSVRIPPGCTGEVFVPAQSPQQVKRIDGKFLRMESDSAVFEVGSGHHIFSAN